MSILFAAARSGWLLAAHDAIHVSSCGEVRKEVGADAIDYITADRRQHATFTAEEFRSWMRCTRAYIRSYIIRSN